MNIHTGEVGFPSDEQLASGDWVPLDKLPDPNCPKCKGRGHTGQPIRVDGKWQYRPCGCTYSTAMGKLHKAVELLESCIADFRKLKPILGDAADKTADLYQQELNKLH